MFDNPKRTIDLREKMSSFGIIHGKASASIQQAIMITKSLACHSIQYSLF